MKKIIMITALLVTGYIGKVHAQAEEVAQLLLNVEKLMQFEQILKDMKKGYTVLQGGYNTIKDVSKGNFSLHKTFLDGLMAVSPTVKNYKKVADIIVMQRQIVKEYKAAHKRFRTNELFSAGDLNYISGVYERLISSTLNNLDDLTMVVTANKLRMSDDERLQAIDRIYDDMAGKHAFLRSFNDETSVLAAQRASEQKDINITKGLHGVNK